jgi:hypothetical protein
VDTEWLLSTLFDASLLSLEPPENGGSFSFCFKTEQSTRHGSCCARRWTSLIGVAAVRVLFACAGLVAAAQAWFPGA